MLKLETRFVNILSDCLYRPPFAPTSFWGALDQQLEEFLGVEHPPPTLLTGDLNVDIWRGSALATLRVRIRTEKNGENQSVKLNPRLRIEPCTHGFRSGLSPRIF